MDLSTVFKTHPEEDLFRFFLRVPRTAEAAARLACKEHGITLSDFFVHAVAELLPEFVEQFKGFPYSSRPIEFVDREYGCVYLAKAGGGLYKIGKSAKLVQRIEQHARERGCTFEVIHWIEVPNMGTAERKVLAMFGGVPCENEWFEFSEEQIERFKNIGAEDLI